MKEYFSLILLTVRKLISTSTHMHSIINQKSVIRNIKPVWKYGVRGQLQKILTFLSIALVRVHLLRSLFCPRYCVWDIEQIYRQGVLSLWSSHSSGLMNHPEAASKRLMGCIWLTLVFCLVHTVLNF